MGLFKRKSRIDKRLRKELQKELKPYLKRDDMEQTLNDRAMSEQRKQLWASMSPNLRLKVLKYIAERQDVNGKK